VDSDAVTGRVDVVAGIVVSDRRVLLCHRSPDRAWYGNVWDFPGGHVDTGESPTAALVRELREELGIVIEEPSEPGFSRLVTSEFDMRIWVVTQWAGAPANASPEEHDDLAWMSVKAIADLPLAHDSYPSLIALALNAATDTECHSH
jgi:mutator protein MutT